VQVLPGFQGSRFGYWRARIHRSIISQIHSLWPPAQAALIDAMVIGEDALISRGTRMDFQRSGTYHVLVVSGMNVSILAFLTFWVIRPLHASEVLAPRDHTARVRVCICDQRRTTHLAGHPDDEHVSGRSAALSRALDAQCCWRSGARDPAG